MSTELKILKLARQLYPTGRAWRMPKDRFFEKLHKALAVSEAEAYEGAVSIMDTIIPDNELFGASDALFWERVFGLVTNESLPLADRILPILRKMRFPGENPAKGHFTYIEEQLQASGFNVYVHENIIELYPTGYDQHNPADLYPSILSVAQHGNGQQHGGVQSPYINHLVINSISNASDIAFGLNSLACTFFIGGQTLGTSANVPSAREIEFRQLILKLKQTQLVAILFINYI